LVAKFLVGRIKVSIKRSKEQDNILILVMTASEKGSAKGGESVAGRFVLKIPVYI
jgi:hypothetical protein